MAFFPKFLKKRFQLYMQAKTRAPFPEDQVPKYNELLIWLRKDNHFVPHLFLCTMDPDPLDEIAIEASYECCKNPELNKVFDWIAKHVLFLIGVDNFLSIGVYTRIGTSMLNKLVKEGKLRQELCMYYHDNFVANTRALIFELNSESLPF